MHSGAEGKKPNKFEELDRSGKIMMKKAIAEGLLTSSTIKHTSAAGPSIGTIRSVPSKFAHAVFVAVDQAIAEKCRAGPRQIRTDHIDPANLHCCQKFIFRNIFSDSLKKQQICMDIPTVAEIRSAKKTNPQEAQLKKRITLKVIRLHLLFTEEDLVCNL